MGIPDDTPQCAANAALRLTFARTPRLQRWLVTRPAYPLDGYLLFFLRARIEEAEKSDQKKVRSVSVRGYAERMCVCVLRFVRTGRGRRGASSRMPKPPTSTART